MTRARSALAALLVLALAACAYMAPIQAPSTYYVVRHLHTPEGAADPDLTEEGQRHARLLADWFEGHEAPATIFPTFSLVRVRNARASSSLGEDATWMAQPEGTVAVAMGSTDFLACGVGPA